MRCSLPNLVAGAAVVAVLLVPIPAHADGFTPDLLPQGVASTLTYTFSGFMLGNVVGTFDSGEGEVVTKSFTSIPFQSFVASFPVTYDTVGIHHPSVAGTSTLGSIVMPFGATQPVLVYPGTMPTPIPAADFVFGHASMSGPLQVGVGQSATFAIDFGGFAWPADPMHMFEWRVTDVVATTTFNGNGVTVGPLADLAPSLALAFDVPGFYFIEATGNVSGNKYRTAPPMSPTFFSSPYSLSRIVQVIDDAPGPDPDPVPEPATFWLLAVAGGMVVARRRRAR